MAIYQIVVKGTFQTTDQLRNVFHYDFPDGVPTTAQIQTAIDYIDVVLKTNIQAVMVNDVNIYAYDVRRVDVGNLPAVEFLATAGAWSGSSAVDPMPSQLSALITWKAQTVFPRSTRMFCFPFSENANSSSGLVEAATQTTLETMATALQTVTVAGITDPIKVAVKYTGTPRAVTSFNTVTENNASAVWATQRRRRLGTGI